MSEPHQSSFYEDLDSKVTQKANEDFDLGTFSSDGPVEFGFEVNVLDLICKSGKQLDQDDEAIVSFGSSIILNSPESGIGSCSVLESSTEAVGHPDSTGCHLNDESMSSTFISQQSSSAEFQDNIGDNAVKIPNYAQIVHYVAKSWNKVEQELKNGLAQKY